MRIEGIPFALVNLKTYMEHNELLELLAQLEAQEREQAKSGVFDDRLLTKINQVKTLLAGGEA